MNEMQEKIVRHYQEMGMPEYTPTRMAELAPGVVAVEDTAGECDVLFDKDQWGYTMPSLWEGGESPPLAEANLAVLPGLGTHPAIRTIEEIVNFARDQLIPKDGQAWYTEFQFFTAAS